MRGSISPLVVASSLAAAAAAGLVAGGAGLATIGAPTNGGADASSTATPEPTNSLNDKAHSATDPGATSLATTPQDDKTTKARTKKPKSYLRIPATKPSPTRSPNGDKTSTHRPSVSPPASSEPPSSPTPTATTS
jgi:hypothetical protein